MWVKPGMPPKALHERKIKTMTNPNDETMMAALRRIREEGSTAAVTHYVHTRWPHIGGPALAPLPERAFFDPAFAGVYQPGHVVRVYVAGSGDTLEAPDEPTGLHGLARRFAIPLFKISATAAENALARIADLNLERYAGMYRADAGLACDPGADAWRLVLIHPSRGPLPGSPVEARPRVIRVVPSSGHCLTGFEKELHRRVRPASLRDWIASPDGRKHCADIGRDPREAMRLTGYNTGEGSGSVERTSSTSSSPASMVDACSRSSSTSSMTMSCAMSPADARTGGG